MYIHFSEKMDEFFLTVLVGSVLKFRYTTITILNIKEHQINFEKKTKQILLHLIDADRFLRTNNKYYLNAKARTLFFKMVINNTSTPIHNYFYIKICELRLLIIIINS